MPSREIKRVPLDFDWPLGETYDDNPYSALVSTCFACDGIGYGAFGRLLRDRWWGYKEPYPDSGRLPPWVVDDFTTSVVRKKVESSLEYYQYGYLTPDDAVRIEANRMCDIWNSRWMNRLTVADVSAIVAAGDIDSWDVDKNDADLLTAVNRATLSSFNMGTLMHTCMAARANCSDEELYCEVCGGDGAVYYIPEIKSLFHNWSGKELTGDGWQLWSLVSDAPISPVLQSPDDLIDWMVDNDGMTEAQASALIHMTHVPSGAIVDGEFLTSADILDGEYDK